MDGLRQPSASGHLLLNALSKRSYKATTCELPIYRIRLKTVFVQCLDSPYFMLKLQKDDKGDGTAKLFLKNLTFCLIRLFFDRFGVDNTNYYYPAVVPSYHNMQCRTPDLGHRLLILNLVWTLDIRRSIRNTCDTGYKSTSYSNYARLENMGR